MALKDNGICSTGWIWNDSSSISQMSYQAKFDDDGGHHLVLAHFACERGCYYGARQCYKLWRESGALTVFFLTFSSISLMAINCRTILDKMYIKRFTHSHRCTWGWYKLCHEPLITLLVPFTSYSDLGSGKKSNNIQKGTVNATSYLN